MFQLLDILYFEKWKSMLKVDLVKEFSTIEHQELEPHSFTFYTSVSVMSSSKIEGEKLDVDSYVKHKILHTEYLPELTEKPNDLFKAYLFAKENKLTQTNFLKAHELVSEHLLPKHLRGNLRKTEMLVMEHLTGRIQYEAAPFSLLEEYFEDFWDDIQILKDSEMNIEQVFYFASYIHLVFVNIHPFSDGNGRMARLLEKWFLAEKLGERAWFVQSEKYYYSFVNEYYKNLAKLGMYYQKLDYGKAMPFLQMLPQSLISTKPIT